MLRESSPYFFGYSEPRAETLARSYPIADTPLLADFTRLPIITQHTDFELFVEAPLVAACKILYEKNIGIVAASIDSQSAPSAVEGFAHILVSWESLSEENKAIAQTFTGMTAVYKYDTGMALEIRFPITAQTLSEQLEEQISLVCKAFCRQEPNFQSFSIEELRRNFSPSLDENYLIRNMGFVYDKVEERFYFSFEQWQLMHPNEKPSNRRIRYKGQWSRNHTLPHTE